MLLPGLHHAKGGEPLAIRVYRSSPGHLVITNNNEASKLIYIQSGLPVATGQYTLRIYQ